MKDFEDMKALAYLCEEAGEEKHQQINAIRKLLDLPLPKAVELWIGLDLAGMVKHK